MKEWEHLVHANHEILARHTGQPLEKVVKDTERDYFMSPEEAKDYGIIDAVYSAQWRFADRAGPRRRTVGGEGSAVDGRRRTRHRAEAEEAEGLGAVQGT